MKNNYCVACELQGKKDQGHVESVIYGKKNKSVKIILCHLHSLELFKVGQIKFLEYYKGCVQSKDLDDKKKSKMDFEFR